MRHTMKRALALAEASPSENVIEFPPGEVEFVVGEEAGETENIVYPVPKITVEALPEVIEEELLEPADGVAVEAASVPAGNDPTAFDQSASIEDVTITITVQPGVFPDGVSLRAVEAAGGGFVEAVAQASVSRVIP